MIVESLSRLKLEYDQKSYIFSLFLPNYYLAIASGDHNQYGMKIAIGPRNDASTVQSLKLAKIKDITK